MASAELSRLSRLVALQTMLQSRQTFTAREAAQRFGISLRTVYRDMRALEQAGVPLYAEEGKGHKLVEGYTLPPVTLSEREANALVTAEQLVARNKDTSFVNDYAEKSLCPLTLGCHRGVLRLVLLTKPPLK